MVRARAKVSRSVQVDASPEVVWPRVATVEALVALMESVRHVEPHDEGYRFTMREYGALGYHVVPVVDLSLEWEPPHRLTFTPVGESARRAQASGLLTVQGDGDGTQVTLRADLDIELSLPRPLRRPAEAVLTHELGSGVARILGRLAAAIDG